MSSHSKLPLLAVGTSSGHLIFIDLSDEKQQPRILETVRVHSGLVNLLKFNTSGTLLFSLGSDNRLFVIDARLSASVAKLLRNNDQRLRTNNLPASSEFEKGMHIFGYIEFEGEAVCMDVIDTLQSSEIKSKVAIGKILISYLSL